MRPGDIVAWRHRGEVQVGAVNSCDEASVWIYKMIPPGWPLRRIVKRRHEVMLVVAASELHPVLIRQAQAALERAERYLAR